MPRPYRSAVRAEQRAATAAAIDRAAAELFVERGYVRTTMRAIATAAGVSLETVFKSAESKRNLLRRVARAASLGEHAALSDSPQIRAALAEPDPRRRWELLRAATSSMIAGALPLDRVVRAAATTDEEIAELWAEVQAERRRDVALLLGLLDDAGLVRLPLQEAIDVTWALAQSTGVFELLVRDRGWSRRRAAALISDLIEQTVLQLPA